MCSPCTCIPHFGSHLHLFLPTAQNVVLQSVHHVLGFADSRMTTPQCEFGTSVSTFPNSFHWPSGTVSHSFPQQPLSSKPMKPFLRSKIAFRRYLHPILIPLLGFTPLPQGCCNATLYHTTSKILIRQSSTSLELYSIPFTP